MKRAIAVVGMMLAMGHAWAQSEPSASRDDRTSAVAVDCVSGGKSAESKEGDSSDRRDGAVVAPCGAKAASAAADGTLTPVYIGAAVAAAATIAGALSGDGSHHNDGPGGTGGTTGTTGTTGTVGGH